MSARPDHNLPTSPVELASYQYPKTFFGYQPRVVDEHLKALAKEWEKLLLPSKTAMELVSAATERAEGVRPYESLGEDISRILLEAREVADKAKAEGGAELLAARDEAAQILAGAQREKDDIVAAAASERENILAAARKENEQLLASNADLRARLAGIVEGVGPLLAAAPDLAPKTEALNIVSEPEGAHTQILPVIPAENPADAAVEVAEEPAAQVESEEAPAENPDGIGFLENALTSQSTSGRAPARGNQSRRKR